MIQAQDRKNRKAKELSIKIIDEEQFLEMAGLK